MIAPRIFLLSPAHCGGKRAAVLLNDRATFPLAERLRSVGLTLGEAFSFLSGLYFRGKLTYAGRFARPPAGCSGIQVITTDRGLIPADATIGPNDLRQFGAGDISAELPQYRVPLQRDLARLEQFSAQVVLLGSVASNKYVDLLLEAFGERLLFPSDFVGRGDMSRGGLLLRAAEAGQELAYEPVAGAVRRGKRPPKLAPRPRRAARA
jgi:hypothetical protein